MNTKALVAAVAAGLIGLALLLLYMKRFEDEATGGPPVAVLMATQDIPLGTSISQEMLGTRSLPSAYVEERHVRASDADRIIGVRVSMGLKSNESLLWTDLASTSQQRRDLSGILRNGMRAVSIRAGATSGFGGLLRPGDRVDVLLTATRPGSGQRVTIPLLQNVMALAVGANTGSGGQSGGGQSSLVTLAVTVEQAQVLTFAGTGGMLTLILRNPNDVAILDQLPETTASDILEPARRVRYIRREPTKSNRPTQLRGGGVRR